MNETLRHILAAGGAIVAVFGFAVLFWFFIFPALIDGGVDDRVPDYGNDDDDDPFDGPFTPLPV